MAAQKSKKKTKVTTASSKKPATTTSISQDTLSVTPQKSNSTSWSVRLNKPWIKVLAVVIVVLAIGAIIFKDQFVVAWVNGKPITRLEYNRAMQAQVGEQVLQDLVTRRLILNEAAKQGVVINLEDINAKISEIEQTLSSQGSTLDQALLAQGLTRAVLQDQVRMQLIVEKLSPQNASASAESIAEFIEQNRQFLPEDATTEELTEIARTQLESSQGQVTAWLDELKDQANISYW